MILCFPPPQSRRALVFPSVFWLLALGILVDGHRILEAQEGELRPSEMIAIGVAKVDITPDYPILLAGYGARTEESEGVDERLWARALAIGARDAEPAVLIAVDNCGVPRDVVERVAARVMENTRVKRDRFVICSTHTHCAPNLSGYAPVIWAGRATADQMERIERYTRELEDHLVGLARRALEVQTSCRLSWAQGRVTFAGNRRVVGDNKWTGFGFHNAGPVDHSLPVMVAKNADGKTVAVWTNYACHCTTLGPQNHIHGDWAGHANAAIEARHADAVALTTIGCGADANPEPRGEAAMARQYGEAIAEEVARVLGRDLTRLQPPLTAAMREVELPFDAIPDRKHWETKKAEGGFEGEHAALQLERLDRGEELPRHLDYPITTWTFGRDLGIVFLAGEVVVDYSIRLKRELDWRRLWINGWANDVPGYIPSRRILQEGGYEADSSQIYYDQPARYAPEVEDIVVNTVTEMLGQAFLAPENATPAPFHRHPLADDVSP